jgi:hypothetical protein
MKLSHICKASVVGIAAILGFTAPTVRAINIDFAAVSGAKVQFNGTGDTFTFLPTIEDQFVITGSDGAGDSVGLRGWMTGNFSIGAITTSGLLQTASVTGSGQLTIYHGLNTLTATLTWDSISTFGAGGIINVNGDLNLSSIVYTGNRSDLLALAAPGQGSEVISFQFVPGKSLTQLTADGAVSITSFSGSVGADGSAPTLLPDGGSSISLLGLSLTGLWFIRRKKA